MRWGLHPEIALRLVVISYMLEAAGIPAPTIISGYRSAEKQKCLLQNWTAGRIVNQDCSMPTVKPACRSTHTGQFMGAPSATGVDLKMSRTTQFYFKPLWLLFNGARWGGDFAIPDPNHYDAPIIGVSLQKIC